MTQTHATDSASPVAPSVIVGSHKHRIGWIVFGVVVVLLTAAAFTFYSVAKATYRNNMRMVMMSGAAHAYSMYEKDKGVRLADDPDWESTLIANGYHAPEMLWCTAFINERAKYVVVTYSPDVTTKVGSSWACFYDDPTLLKPGAKACIVFPDMEVIQVPPPELLDEIRKGLAQRNLPYDAAHPGLQPAKSVAK